MTDEKASSQKRSVRDRNICRLPNFGNNEGILDLNKYRGHGKLDNEQH